MKLSLLLWMKAQMSSVVTQLAMFIHGCYSNFVITEELLESIPMHGTTTGEDIFCEIERLIQKYELLMKELVSTATDGGPAL
jgi:hypothetical protein